MVNAPVAQPDGSLLVGTDGAGVLRSTDSGRTWADSNVGFSERFVSRVLFAPSKAANAGSVAVSGLEMTQNSMRLSWTRGELNRRLRDIMANIHDRCIEYGTEGGHVDYLKGANIAGFVKVADAMLAYGVM